MTSRLDLPSRKVFVKELYTCEKKQMMTPSASQQHWMIVRPDRELQMRKNVDILVVWIQGKVVDVKNDTLTLNDGTGIVTIQRVSKVPQGNPADTPGKYVMVIGEIVQTGPSPVVDAIKIQDLSNEPLSEKVWMYEVMDAHFHGTK